MKKVIAFALFFLFAATAYSRNAGQAPDYGTRVNIKPGYETSLDLSYREAANTSGGMMVQNAVPCLYPIWHPTGERIFFVDHHNIFSVPVTGGQPRLEFESNCLYPYNGRQYILDQTIWSLIGFSPDGKKLYFSSALVGEGSVVQVTIKEIFDKDGKFTGASIGVEGSSSAVQCLDLNTGMAKIIARNAWGIAMSRSGKYLAYNDITTIIVRVRDLKSGQEWKINSSFLGVSFIDDEQILLYPKSGASAPKLFTVPVLGGEPQQLTSSPSVPGTIFFLDCAPGGERAIYTYFTGENYSYGDQNNGGADAVRRLCISNLKTGETADIVPFSKAIPADWARFSPDGKQICYIRNNHDNLNDPWGLYIKDISLPDIQVSVANTAPQGFALTGNYPNPFNPSTTISFSLPETGQASLTVYNVHGQKVRELVSGTLSAGKHSVVWDGCDRNGNSVSSGVYISRLTMRDKVTANRMLFLK